MSFDGCCVLCWVCVDVALVPCLCDVLLYVVLVPDV